MVKSASFEDDEPTTLLSSKAFSYQAAQANAAGDEQEPDREPSPDKQSASPPKAPPSKPILRLDGTWTSSAGTPPMAGPPRALLHKVVREQPTKAAADNDGEGSDYEEDDFEEAD